MIKKSIFKRIGAVALAAATALVLIPFGGKDAKAREPQMTTENLAKVEVKITEPAVGANPTFFDNDGVEGATYHAHGAEDEYSTQGLGWKNSDGKFLKSTDVFEAGKYTYVFAVNGLWVMDESTGDSVQYQLTKDTVVTVNGQAATCVSGDEGEGGVLYEGTYKMEFTVGATEPAELKDVTPVDNAAGLKLASDSEALNAAVLSDADREALAAGKEVKVWMTATDITEAVPATDKALIEGAASNLAPGVTIAGFFDFTLKKSVDGTESTVSETKKPVKISVAISEKLLKENREFALVNAHGGKAYTIPLKVNGTVGSADASLFSTYALVYYDKAAATTTAATTAAKAASPKTGDSTFPFATLAILGLAAVAGAYSLKKYVK